MREAEERLRRYGKKMEGANLIHEYWQKQAKKQIEEMKK